jgi:hypothetical protein
VLVRFAHWFPATQRIEGTLPPILHGTRPTAAWLRVAAEGAARFLVGLLARLATVCCSAAAFAGSRAYTLEIRWLHALAIAIQRCDWLTKLVSIPSCSIYSQPRRADRLTKLVSIAFSSIFAQFRTSQLHESNQARR